MQDLSWDNECLPQKRKNAEEKSLHKVRKILLTCLIREYRLEQKLKEEEQGKKNVKEMHVAKMRRFDRLLDLYEKDISK